MTVGKQSESSGRKLNLMDTLNLYDDRDQDLVRSSMPVPSPAYGLHQVAFRHHNIQDGAPTSSRGLASYLANVQLCKDAIGGRRDEAAVEGFKKEMKDLEDLLSKLNPMAEEFVPSSLAGHGNGSGWRYSNALGFQNADAEINAGHSNRRSTYCQEKRRMNSRTNLAQRGEVIRRTVYVSDIDHQVTEEQLATLFINCGQVVDCRICGDPNSILRFAFIEFTDEDGASAALGLSGTMLGYYPVRVLPSKTAIAPVNPTFLPRSEDEREMCGRTVYCTNIDKKVTQLDLKLFFESLCGEVYRLRLLGDYHYSTRIAFVEFVEADSATAALNCSGATLGSQPIRVSPSKTPVRPRPPRYAALRM
ncbi:polyadenylate-binding protein-interacting protein 11-like isoform X2 [Phalaenopsis equestris]|uniref:polyadenylate-binding protein-interacting protein 11-like isoform X2 n=1 Tax=Phalaenopsis equestris TaxID=78828 RepID=UPI0009E51CB7|nr:polyadenylate-binding protein-interacting protein 11-like isoform X2 [Phalaenopsis equestris]